MVHKISISVFLFFFRVALVARIPRVFDPSSHRVRVNFAFIVVVIFFSSSSSSIVALGEVVDAIVVRHPSRGRHSSTRTLSLSLSLARECFASLFYPRSKIRARIETTFLDAGERRRCLQHSQTIRGISVLLRCKNEE